MRRQIWLSKWLSSVWWMHWFDHHRDITGRQASFCLGDVTSPIECDVVRCPGGWWPSWKYASEYTKCGELSIVGLCYFESVNDVLAQSDSEESMQMVDNVRVDLCYKCTSLFTEAQATAIVYTTKNKASVSWNRQSSVLVFNRSFKWSRSVLE